MQPKKWRGRHEEGDQVRVYGDYRNPNNGIEGEIGSGSYAVAGSYWTDKGIFEPPGLMYAFKQTFSSFVFLFKGC